MLDPAILPYLITAVLSCLAILTIIVGPAIVKLVRSINELICIGGEEDQPDYDTPEDIL